MSAKVTLPWGNKFPIDTGVSHLVKVLGKNLVLKDLSFSVSLGEFVAILGASGCGKTTLLRCIAGLETPTEGKIWINGVLVFGEGVRVPTRKREIGMVFQSYACWPHMTVYENVAFPLKIRRMDEATIHIKVEEILRLVDLSELGHRYPGQLSGGQQQRVSLARSLSYDPKLLLLDEPLSNLDANLRMELRREIRRIQEETKVTTLYVTHDQEEAFALADRILIMRNGIIIEEGEPDEIRMSPRTAYTATFLDTGSVLYGTLIEESTGGRKIVKVGNSFVETKDPANHNIGTEVGLFLPRESIRIHAMKDQESLSSAASRNSIIGEVMDMEYSGGNIEVKIKVASQELVHQMSKETEWSVSPGAKVIVSVNPDYVKIVEAG